MGDNDCIFCKIVAGEIPSEKVYEDALKSFTDANYEDSLKKLLIAAETHMSHVGITTQQKLSSY